MIRGIISCVPANVVKNEDEAFIRATGVRERRIANNGLHTAALGTKAALHLLDKLHCPPDAIGALVVVTQTPMVRMPATACIIAAGLGINCPAFDVNLACSGYVYGLQIAFALAREYDTVLLIAGDTVSTMTRPDDKLFGDAVTATLVEWESSCINFKLGTEGMGFESLIADPLIRMDGAAVVNFALQTVPKLVADTTTNAFCDWYFFHQANGMILKHLTKKCNLDPQKVPTNIEKYGNTSSASIPLLMCDSGATERLKETRNRVAMFGFGAGWSWGGVMLELAPLQVCEVIEV